MFLSANPGVASDATAPSSVQRPEAALVALARDGDDDAFAALVRPHERRLWSVAANLLRDHSEAEDAVQETLLSAHRSLRAFRGEAAVSTWLTRICVRQCLDRLRFRKIRDQFRVIWPFGPGEEPAVDPEPAADHGLRRRIDEALARLPLRQRTVVVLRVFEEMTIPEIARAIGLAEGTVKAHLFRATHALRGQLEDLR